MKWPKLSEALTGPRSPDQCQACGARWVELIRWFECDDDDKPTRVVVVTCKPCERTVITPHDRLYVQLQEHEQHPGSMELCQLCRRRDGLDCPEAAFNGGPGVRIESASFRLFVRASRRSLSGPRTVWRPPTGCDRREVLAIVG